MTEKLRSFLGRSLSFTPEAARWVIGLSVLSILKSLLLPSLVSTPMLGLIRPLLQMILPLYIVLYIVFLKAKSEYASVCFARGSVNLIAYFVWEVFVFDGRISQTEYFFLSSLGPVLSFVLIVFVLWTERIPGSIVATAAQGPELSLKGWKQFFFSPGLSLASLVLVALLAVAFGPAQSARELQRMIGTGVFFLSLAGIVLHGLATIFFLFRGRRSLALGSALSVFLLCFTGFFGCVAALSGTNFH